MGLSSRLWVCLTGFRLLLILGIRRDKALRSHDALSGLHDEIFFDIE